MPSSPGFKPSNNNAYRRAKTAFSHKPASHKQSRKRSHYPSVALTYGRKRNHNHNHAVPLFITAKATTRHKLKPGAARMATVLRGRGMTKRMRRR